MKNFPMTPTEMISGIWRNRELTLILIRRDITERYRGSFFGLLWSFAQPALMLVVYTAFFGKIMRTRWVDETESTGNFALILFSGLLVFNMFAECLNRSPSLILANVNYVKRVVFPLEILPVVALGSALFQTSVSILVWLIGFVFLCGVPHFTVFYFPVIILPLIFLILGSSWFFAVVGAYFRDISSLMSIITTMFLFLSPVFYSANNMPTAWQFLLRWNPLAPIIENSRRVLWYGAGPDWKSFSISMCLSVVVAWIGFAVFQRARKEFADGI